MKKKSPERDRIVLQSLNDCAHAFLKTQELKQSIYTVYETCKKLIGATAGYAALLSADETLNDILFLDMGSIPCNLDPDLPMPVRGLRGVAYSSNKVVYENNFHTSKWQKYLPDGHGKLDNVLFAPLVIEDKTSGVLGFANKPEGFHDDDVLVVKAFAELAAVGLAKNRTVTDLENNVKQLRALMLTANDAIVTVDQEGRIFLWNHAAEQTFGYSADEVIGKPCTCIIPDKYVQAHKAGFEEVVRSGISKVSGNQVEVEAQKKNGEIFPIQLSVSKWKADDSLFFTGIVRDISSRLQMEQEVKLSEKRLREIFKLMNSGGGVYKAADDGEDFIILEYYRPSHLEHAEVYGDLIGRGFLDVFPASKQYGLLDVFKRVWKTGKPEFHPVTIYNSVGEIIAWRTNYVYKLSTDEIVAIYEDVTEKKQMEKALLESENLFRSIFETSPDPISLNRLDNGKYVLVNNKFLELTGFTNREVIGRTALEIEIWKDPKRRDQFFEQLINKWQVNDFEAEFRRKDGKALTALVSATLLSYQNKPHTLAVSRDVTEVKKTEQALLAAHTQLKERYVTNTKRLKESEIKYSSLLEALLTGVYMCLEKKIVFVNQQFCEMFGYTKNELLGMDMMELIHPEDRHKAQEICSIAQTGETVECGYEVRGIRKNGDMIYLSGRNSTVDYKGRKAVLGNIANISKRVKALKEQQKSEAGLRILSAQLLSAEERERKRIARDIHDDIGQALTAIKFSVESSLDSMNDRSFASAQKALEKILPLAQQSIDEVRKIIMDLRPSTLDDLGLVATISWLCRDFESIFMDINVQKEIDVKEGDIPVALKTVIYRILQEALNNAAKYSRTKYILLKLAKAEGNLELLVEDKGVGFDPQGLDTRNSLGLASMKERVLMSGGKFSLLSAPGIGTRIQISWPLADSGVSSGEKHPDISGTLVQ